MDNFPGWTTRFELMFRQEQSTHASGRVRVKDFGTPIWRASYQSRLMRPNELDEWRARLSALGNGLGTFQAWPTSRCWPINYPNGSSLPTGITVASMANGNQVILSEPLNLTVGDYLQVGVRLHQIVAVTGGTYTLAPQLSVGALVGDPVTINRPSVAMALVPGSVSTQSGLNGRGSISFEGMEARG